MMQPNRMKLLLVTGSLVLAGTFGGMALANFAVGGAAGPTAGGRSSWVADDMAKDDPPVLASAVMTDGPKDYVCKGCGPSLYEQRIKDDAAHMGHVSGPLEPLPAHHASDNTAQAGMAQDGEPPASY